MRPLMLYLRFGNIPKLIVLGLSVYFKKLARKIS